MSDKPWTYQSTSGPQGATTWVVHRTGSEKVLCECKDSYDVERIVACLNALDLFSTEAIKSGEAMKAIRGNLLRT